jgi:hypothetical protein
MSRPERTHATILVWLALATAAPAMAQFRTIEVSFQGMGCVSCIESMPERLRRLRGVETASVDAAKSVVSLRLAEKNRIRLEQVRDLIEQDGTKTLRASVEAAGTVRLVDGKGTFEPAGTAVQYWLETAGTKLSEGDGTLRGEIANLRPAEGRISIRATSWVAKS